MPLQIHRDAVIGLPTLEPRLLCLPSSMLGRLSQHAASGGTKANSAVGGMRLTTELEHACM